jgi:hypothetical protein
VSSADALDTPTLGPTSPLLRSPGSPLMLPTVSPAPHTTLGETLCSSKQHAPWVELGRDFCCTSVVWHTCLVHPPKAQSALAWSLICVNESIAGWEQAQSGGWGRSLLLDTVTLEEDVSMYLMLAPGQLGIPPPPQVI